MDHQVWERMVHGARVYVCVCVCVCVFVCVCVCACVCHTLYIMKILLAIEFCSRLNYRRSSCGKKISAENFLCFVFLWLSQFVMNACHVLKFCGSL